ncbi:TPA: hypothetical protein DCX16_06815 [bacterium]|nr:hypothetical protein [bacterium]
MEDFKIIKFLGEGGFGKTYLTQALDEELERDYGKYFVMKFPHTRKEDELLARELIINAALVLKLKDLKDKNLVRFFDFLKYKDHYAMVMEYIDGGSLKDMLVDKKPLPIDKALLIIEDVLLGLTYLHSAGILHRDIKPSNILITKEGKAKLSDFGIAKLIESKEKLFSRTGSYAYIPKERIIGGKEDFSSDTYSIGITLYEAITGRNPFSGNSPGEVIKNILNNEPPQLMYLNNEVGENLSNIVLRSISKDQSKRFKTAQEFLKIIREYRMSGIKKDTYIKIEPENEESKKPKMFVPVGEWDEK